MVAEGIPLDSAGDKQYSEKLAERIQKNTGIETKFARLAHVVRGGSPTLRDRLLAARMGDAAVEALLDGKSNLVVCLQNDNIVEMDIGYALSLDRLYKGKVQPGELEAKYTAEPVSYTHLIAYEPVWAIGTGKTATAEQADDVCGIIRNTVAVLYGNEIAEALTIQYGGSMNAANAEELLGKLNVDGGLIGGASLLSLIHI